MKTRTGFVSNSSSSSFIVRFSQDPTDENALREMMGDCGVNPYGTAVSTDEVIKIVHRDIQAQANQTKTAQPPFEVDEWDLQHDAEQLLHNAGFYYEDVNGTPWDEAVKEMEASILEFQTNMFFKIKGISPLEWKEQNKFVYKFTFSDEDGAFWAAMEHGGVFRNVDHDKQSNH